MNLIKFANALDEKKKFKESDSITEYLLDLVKSKQLRSFDLDTELPSQLLALEKTGVDTSKYYEALKEENLCLEDLEEIGRKLESNLIKDLTPKSTDLHEYVIWMNRDKESNNEDKEDISAFLKNLRSSFIDFLTDVVLKDFSKENDDISADNLINFYFKNKDKYEKDLEDYDLMQGQTEGILSDESFADELNEEESIHGSGPMERTSYILKVNHVL